MRLKITSDGTTEGTKVVDEQGAVVDGITALYFQIENGSAPKLLLEVVAPKIEALTDSGLVTICPHCGAEEDLWKKAREEVLPQENKKFWEAISNCHKCNLAPNITIHHPDLDPSHYTEIYCRGCSTRVEGKTFFEALEIWEHSS